MRYSSRTNVGAEKRVSSRGGILARAISINKYCSFRYGGLFVLAKASINPKVRNWKKHSVAL